MKVLWPKRYPMKLYCISLSLGKGKRLVFRRLHEAPKSRWRIYLEQDPANKI